MQPVIIEDLISVAANTVNANVIASNPSLSRYLRSPFRAKGELIATQSAAGLIVDFDYGSKNVVANSTLRVSTIFQAPQDVLNGDWYCDEGSQMVLRVSNPTGGALSIRYRITLLPWEEEFPPDCRTMQSGPISIAAGAVDTQLLAGLRYERPPVDSLLRAFMTASAAGLLRQVYVDTDSISPPSAIAPINAVPVDPFDITIEGVECPADKKIELSVSNPTGGALNVFWKIKLQELVRA